MFFLGALWLSLNLGETNVQKGRFEAGLFFSDKDEWFIDNLRGGPLPLCRAEPVFEHPSHLN